MGDKAGEEKPPPRAGLHRCYLLGRKCFWLKGLDYRRLWTSGDGSSRNMNFFKGQIFLGKKGVERCRGRKTGEFPPRKLIVGGLVSRAAGSTWKGFFFFF